MFTFAEAMNAVELVEAFSLIEPLFFILFLNRSLIRRLCSFVWKRPDYTASEEHNANAVDMFGVAKGIVHKLISQVRSTDTKDSHVISNNVDDLKSLADGKFIKIDISGYLNDGLADNALIIIRGEYTPDWRRNYDITELASDFKVYPFSIWRQQLTVDTYNVDPNNSNALDTFLHSYDLTNNFEYYAYSYTASEPDHYFQMNNNLDINPSSNWFTDNLVVDTFVTDNRDTHVKSTSFRHTRYTDKFIALHKMVKKAVLDNTDFYDYNVIGVKILRPVANVPSFLESNSRYNAIKMDVLYSNLPTYTVSVTGGYKRIMYPYFFVPNIVKPEGYRLDHHTAAIQVGPIQGTAHPSHRLIGYYPFNKMRTYMFYDTLQGGQRFKYDYYSYVVADGDNVVSSHEGFGGSFSYGMTLQYPGGEFGHKYVYGTLNSFYNAYQVLSGYASVPMMQLYGSSEYQGITGSLTTWKYGSIPNLLHHYYYDWDYPSFYIYHHHFIIPTGLMLSYQEFLPIYIIDSYFIYLGSDTESIILKPPTYSRYALTPRQYNFHFRVPFGINHVLNPNGTVLDIMRKYMENGAYTTFHEGHRLFPDIYGVEGGGGIPRTIYASSTMIHDYHTFLPGYNLYLDTLAQATMNSLNNRLSAFSDSFITPSVKDYIRINFANWLNNYSSDFRDAMFLYQFGHSPTIIRGLLWSNIYFRKRIEPNTAYSLGMDLDHVRSLSSQAQEALSDSINQYNNPICHMIPYGVYSYQWGPQHVLSCAYSSSLFGGTYYGGSAAEQFFNFRTVALAMQSFALAVPDYPPVVRHTGWPFLSFDSMLSYNPFVEASKAGLGYEYRFAIHYYNIPIPWRYFGSRMFLVCTHDNSCFGFAADEPTLPTFTYNETAPLYFAVISNRHVDLSLKNAHRTSLNAWHVNSNSELRYIGIDASHLTSSASPARVFIFPPDYGYNFKLPGPLRSITTHRFLAGRDNDNEPSPMELLYATLRYENYGAYQPLYPYRDVNTILPRFDLRPHLKAYNVFRNINDIGMYKGSQRTETRLNGDVNDNPLNDQNRIYFGYPNRLYGMFYTDVGGAWIGIEGRMGRSNISIPDADMYVGGFDLSRSFSHIAYGTGRFDPELSWTPFVLSRSGGINITTSLYRSILFGGRDILVRDSALVYSWLMFFINPPQDKLAAGTFSDYRTWYLPESQNNTQTVVPHYLITGRVDLQISNSIAPYLFASILQNLAFYNRMFFPNIRLRPLGITIFAPPSARFHNYRVYGRIFDDIVTKNSYYQTDLLAPLYITYNPIGAYVMVNASRAPGLQDGMRGIGDGVILADNYYTFHNMNPDVLNQYRTNFANYVRESYDLIGPWNFHNILFPAVSTGEVKMPQAWAFSHPRMWPRPVISYYYPTRVTPNPVHYFYSIIKFEHKVYQHGRRPYHVLDIRKKRTFVLPLQLRQHGNDVYVRSLNNDFYAVYHGGYVYVRCRHHNVEPIVPRRPSASTRMSVLNIATSGRDQLTNSIEIFDDIVGGKVLHKVATDSSIRDSYVSHDYVHPIEDGFLAGSAYYSISDAYIVTGKGHIQNIRDNKLDFTISGYPYDKDTGDILITNDDSYEYETTNLGWSEALYFKVTTDDTNWSKHKKKSVEVNHYKGYIDLIRDHMPSYGFITSLDKLAQSRSYITMANHHDNLTTSTRLHKGAHLSVIGSRFTDLSEGIMYQHNGTLHGNRLVFFLDTASQTSKITKYSDDALFGHSILNTGNIDDIVYTTDIKAKANVSLYKNKDIANVFLHECDRNKEPLIVCDNPWNTKKLLFLFTDNQMKDITRQFGYWFFNIRYSNPYAGFWHMEYVGFITDYAWNKWQLSGTPPRDSALTYPAFRYQGLSDVKIFIDNDYYISIDGVVQPDDNRNRLGVYTGNINRSSTYYFHASENRVHYYGNTSGLMSVNDYADLYDFSVLPITLAPYAPFLNFALYDNYFGGVPKKVYYSNSHSITCLYLPEQYYDFQVSDQNLVMDVILNPLYRFLSRDIDLPDEPYVLPANDIVTRLFSYRLPIVVASRYFLNELPRYRVYPTSTVHLDSDVNKYDKGMYRIDYVDFIEQDWTLDYGSTVSNKVPFLKYYDFVNGSYVPGFNSRVIFYNEVAFVKNDGANYFSYDPSNGLSAGLVEAFWNAQSLSNTVPLEYSYEPLIQSFFDYLETVTNISNGFKYRQVRPNYFFSTYIFDKSRPRVRIGVLFAWPYDLIGANTMAEKVTSTLNNVHTTIKAWYWPYYDQYAFNLMHINAQRTLFSPIVGYGYWLYPYRNSNYTIDVVFKTFGTMSDSIRSFYVNTHYGYSYGKVVNPYQEFYVYKRQRLTWPDALILDRSEITRYYPDQDNRPRTSITNDLYHRVPGSNNTNIYRYMTLYTGGAAEIPTRFLYNMLISNYIPPIPIFASINVPFIIHKGLDNLNYTGSSFSSNLPHQNRSIPLMLFTKNYIHRDIPPFGTPLGASFYLQQYMLTTIPLFFFKSLRNSDNTINTRWLFARVHFNQEIALKHFIPPELYYDFSYSLMLSEEHLDNPNIERQYEPFYNAIAKLNLVYTGNNHFNPLISYGTPFVRLFYPFASLSRELDIQSLDSNIGPDLIYRSKPLYKYDFNTKLGIKNHGMPLYSIYIDGAFDSVDTQYPWGAPSLSKAAFFTPKARLRVNNSSELIQQVVNSLDNVLGELGDAAQLALAASMNFLAGPDIGLSGQIVLDKLKLLYSDFDNDTGAYDLLLFFFHGHEEPNTVFINDFSGVLGHPRDQNTIYFSNSQVFLKRSPLVLDNVSLTRIVANQPVYSIPMFTLQSSYTTTKVVLEYEKAKISLFKELPYKITHEKTFDFVRALLGDNIDILSYPAIKLFYHLSSEIMYTDFLYQGFNYRSYVPLPNEGVYIFDSDLEFKATLNQSITAKSLFFVGNPFYIRSEIANKININFVYNMYDDIVRFYRSAKRTRHKVRMPFLRTMRISVGIMPLGYNATHAYQVGPAGAVGARNYAQYTDRHHGEFLLPPREANTFGGSGMAYKNYDDRYRHRIAYANEIGSSTMHQQNYYASNDRANVANSLELALFYSAVWPGRSKRVIKWAVNPYVTDVLTIYAVPVVIDPNIIYFREAMACSLLYMNDLNIYGVYTIPHEYTRTYMEEEYDLFFGGTHYRDPYYTSSWSMGNAIQASGIALDRFVFTGVSTGRPGYDFYHFYMQVPRRWMQSWTMYSNLFPMVSYNSSSNYGYYAYFPDHSMLNYLMSMYNNHTHTLLYLSHVLGSCAHNNKVVHEMRFDMPMLNYSRYSLSDGSYRVEYLNNVLPHWPGAGPARNARLSDTDKSFLASPHHFGTLRVLRRIDYNNLFKTNIEILTVGNGEVPSYSDTIRGKRSPYFWTKRDVIQHGIFNIISHAYYPNLTTTMPFYGIRLEDSNRPVRPYEWLGGIYFVLLDNQILQGHNVTSTDDINIAKVYPRTSDSKPYLPLLATYHTSLSTRRLALYRTALFASDIEPQPLALQTNLSHAVEAMDTAKRQDLGSSYIEFVLRSPQWYEKSLYAYSFIDNYWLPFKSNTLVANYNSAVFYAPECTVHSNLRVTTDLHVYNVGDYRITFGHLTSGLFYSAHTGSYFFDTLVRNTVVKAPNNQHTFMVTWNYAPFSNSARDDKPSSFQIFAYDVNVGFFVSIMHYPIVLRIPWRNDSSDDTIKSLRGVPGFVLADNNYDKHWSSNHTLIVKWSFGDSYSIQAEKVNLPNGGVYYFAYNIPSSIDATLMYVLYNFPMWWQLNTYKYTDTITFRNKEYRHRGWWHQSLSDIYVGGNVENILIPVANAISHYMYDPLYLDTGRIFMRGGYESYYYDDIAPNPDTINYDKTIDTGLWTGSSYYKGFTVYDAMYDFRYSSLTDSELNFSSGGGNIVTMSYADTGCNLNIQAEGSLWRYGAGFRSGSRAIMQPYGGYDQAFIKQGTGASIANFYHLIDNEPSLVRLWSIQNGLNMKPYDPGNDDLKRELDNEYGVPVSNNHLVSMHGLYYEATMPDYFLGNMFLYREGNSSLEGSSELLYEGHPLPHPNFVIMGISDNIPMYNNNPLPEIVYSAPPMSYTTEIKIRLYTQYDDPNGVPSNSNTQTIVIRPYQEVLRFDSDSVTTIGNTTVQLVTNTTYTYEKLLQNSCFAQHTFPAMIVNHSNMDYHTIADYINTNGGVFANIASSYLYAKASSSGPRRPD